MAKVPYASIVGSLMYAMVCTRLDIAHLLQHIKDGTSINWMSSLHSSMAYSKKRSMWRNHQDL
uniref:Retrovirus-related Pol polyprotein from transposon TNT 1-94 n=1 Tax=Cajanus cajan TaxID=3821 RepID=A0A151SZ03_CAJCA|nr:Retrovirus-related Pol polyprotein from transposon TNT 1-94 [Cajanus cajan]